MRRYFFILALASMSASFAGKVVFLHGTAGAGKSSLCNEIVTFDNTWRMVSEDDIYYSEAVLYWKREFPEELKAIENAIDSENILHAVMRTQILFKASATKEQRLKAKEAILTVQKNLDARKQSDECEEKGSWSATLRDYITQLIIDTAQEHNVVIETWFLKPEHVQKVTQVHDIKHVIAYCSFEEIIKRTIKRNCEALMEGKDISNLRFFHQALKSFSGLYEISCAAEGSIASLDQASIVHGLDIIEVCLQDSPLAIGSYNTFTRGEFSLEEFQEYRKKLLDKCGSKTVYVVPKFHFDLVVRTDKKSLFECAQEIIQFTKR